MSQQGKFTINNDGDSFKALFLTRFRREQPEVILWNRGGEVRLVPLAVYQNAKELTLAYQALVDMGRLAEIPDGIGRIYWEQTMPLIPNETSTVSNPTPPPQPPLQ